MSSLGLLGTDSLSDPSSHQNIDDFDASDNDELIENRPSKYEKEICCYDTFIQPYFSFIKCTNANCWILRPTKIFQKEEKRRDRATEYGESKINFYIYFEFGKCWKPIYIRREKSYGEN